MRETIQFLTVLLPRRLSNGTGNDTSSHVRSIGKCFQCMGNGTYSRIRDVLKQRVIDNTTGNKMNTAAITGNQIMSKLYIIVQHTPYFVFYQYRNFRYYIYDVLF
jgi:hypothetical protein